jgi:serpin B
MSLKALGYVGLVSTLCFSLGSHAALNPGAEISFRLYKSLSKGLSEENFIFSPYAIRSALGLAGMGARGRTQRQLGKAPEPWTQKKDSPYKLIFANRLWVQMGFPLLDGYMEASDKAFGVRPWMVDFTKAPDFLSDRINGWVEEKTQNKVRQVIQEDLVDPTSKMMLSSAVYFKGDWVAPFQRSETTLRGFKSISGGEIQTSFVHKTGNFLHFKNHEVQILEIPYLDGELAMTLIMPNSSRAWSSLDTNFKPEVVEQWLTELTLKEVSVFLPKFEFDSNIDLTDALKTAGVVDPFDPEQADFSGMTGKRDLVLGHVIHKTVIALTEEGSEVTGRVNSSPARGLASSSTTQHLAFHAERPFMFMIRHRGTNSAIFMGHFLKPTALVKDTDAEVEE